jgi:hypothetical protein
MLKQPFTSLEIPLLSLIQGDENTYLVYSDPTNFVTVSANTAYEACEKSGIKIPFKIVHSYNLPKTICNHKELSPSKKPTEENNENEKVNEPEKDQ